MKREQGGPADARQPDADDENEHEKNRRIKSEQERLLRKQLVHLRPAQRDEAEEPIERPRR